MRPIDADELKDGFNTHFVSEKYGYENIDIREVIERIDAMPTLGGTPISAYWIPECPNKRTGKAYSHTCSECGRTVYDERQVSIDELGYRFCPHCGAKMDEVEE